MIVVDANVPLYMVITGEHTAEASRLLAVDPEWVAPTLWRSEVCHVLVRHVRGGLLTLEDAVSRLHEAQDLISREFATDHAAALTAAVDMGLSGYNAEYVSLARRLSVPLVTADARILAAAPAIAITPGAFARQSPR